MEFNEIKAAKINELNDGELKKVSDDNIDVILTRQDGEYRAFGGVCTHHGAPLEDGITEGGCVMCPWHHAEFSLENGEMKNYPAFDDLEEFDVEVRKDEVIVKIPQGAAGRKTPQLQKSGSVSEDRLFVVLGGGAAGAAAVETLRRKGFTGRIKMITREIQFPYDRTLLSKSYLAQNEDLDMIPIRGQSFYDFHNIEVLKSKTVKKVDPLKQKIEFTEGQPLGYDKLLAATGGRPRRLKIPGAELGRVFTLRSFEDAEDIIRAAEMSKTAVVIGASFIGMECAASLAGRGILVTVAAPETVPFENIFGREIGEVFKELHEQNEIDLRLETRPVMFEGNGTVDKVILENKETIPADMVIMGIGVDPATDYFDEKMKNSDGSVDVDEFMRVKGFENNNLYAAGDIAAFISPTTGKRIRIEHWRTAQQQGRAAARNMAGKGSAFNDIPFFWTRQLGVGLQYVGHAEKWDDIFIDGDLKERKFIAYYFYGGKLIAAAGMSRPKEMCALHACLQNDMRPSAEDITKGDADWLKMADKI